MLRSAIHLLVPLLALAACSASSTEPRPARVPDGARFDDNPPSHTAYPPPVVPPDTTCREGGGGTIGSGT